MKNLEEYLKETKIAYEVKLPADEHQDLIVLVTKIWKPTFELVVLEPCSWKSENNKNVRVQYVTSGSVKFDLCSHFYYTGEDSFIEKEPDSYYHVCGDYSYRTMIITQCAILHIAKEVFEKNGTRFNCGDEFNSILKQFMEIFEKEYEVTEIDLKEWEISELQD